MFSVEGTVIRHYITRDICSVDTSHYDLYSSPNIVLVIKARKMRWAGHVARMGERRGVYGVFVGTPEGKVPL